MTTINTPAIRPATVTIVQWLAYIQGALSILAGIFFFVYRNDEYIGPVYTTNEATIAGLIAIAIGLVTWWVATSYAVGHASPCTSSVPWRCSTSDRRSATCSSIQRTSSLAS